MSKCRESINSCVTFSCSYGDNPKLHRGAQNKKHFKMLLGILIGVLVILLVLFLGSLLFMRSYRRKTYEKKSDAKGLYAYKFYLALSMWGGRADFLSSAFVLCSSVDSKRSSTKPSMTYSIARGANLMDDGITYYIALAELEEATQNFSKKIGKGSFGSVFYGKMKDGKEVAVKIMADLTSHGNQQFVTEVV